MRTDMIALPDPDDKVKGLTDAISMLFAHSVNQLMTGRFWTDGDNTYDAMVTSVPDTPPYDGCCPECCGPCNAIKWFRNNAKQVIEAAVDGWWPGRSWDWQNPDGSIKWDLIEECWFMTDCHGKGIKDL